MSEQDVSHANKAYFDGSASDFNEQHDNRHRAQSMANEILRTHGNLFKPDQTSVLDFACGTGLVSQVLLLHAKSVLGVDISSGMIDEYNKMAAQLQSNSPGKEISARAVDLIADPGALGGQKFDIITCAASYHHFDDIDAVTEILYERLNPGGSLLVVDMLVLDPGEEPDVHPETAIQPEEVIRMVPYIHGLSENQMSSAFASAGLKNFSLSRSDRKQVRVHIHGRYVTLFVARGDRPAV
ncbi:S-adenosyl-L-methionine-dependent methyltransferase [Coniophora puteana RWD-64-598 SS2]|uniref:S-adenosyl-L-methionine-dependent methyltransferase n=1 Tax=Coniophora puteana (strain RWD-64-598) TaxID=741705 RepID=A0A5M3N2I5_CONPW|nr:S-adenosyl-L-methionine-dependent methyltransferase [Coniophora puteana RWD-64-598 SS2]EIW85593.1 S-adenosyl-L-methionine-dependent methyltransferase [Coniophora puteana RWD-64-598 SS2]